MIPFDDSILARQKKNLYFDKSVKNGFKENYKALKLPDLRKVETGYLIGLKLRIMRDYEPINEPTLNNSKSNASVL